MKIVIAATRRRAEERWLYQAASATGEAQLCDSDECLRESRTWPSDTVVLNRVLSLTQALALAHLLEGQGTRTINSAAVIAACGNKVATTARLHAAGVPMPQTRIAFTREQALAAVAELGYPLVLKPIIGSWGRLVAKANDADAVEGLLDYQDAMPSANFSVYYLQRFVAPPCRDLRAFVAGGTLVCLVERRAEHWIRNLTRHQQPHRVSATDEITKCALAAAAAVGGGVVGVDILEDGEGRLVVLEVNHRPEFRWTQQAADADIAAAVVDWVRSGGS